MMGSKQVWERAPLKIAIFFIAAWSIQSSTVMSMIVSLSLEELLATSNLVAIVQVVDKIRLKNNSTKNLLYVKEIIKGTWDSEKLLPVETDRPRFEDTPKFGKICSKALIFLQKDTTGHFRINNFLQGIMPIDDKGNLYGFGLGHNIEEIKDLVKNSFHTRNGKRKHGFKR